MKKFSMLGKLIIFLITAIFVVSPFALEKAFATTLVTTSFQAQPVSVNITNTNSSFQFFFTLNGIPNNAIIYSAALNYQQSGTSNGLITFTDSYSSDTIDGISLSNTGAISSYKIKQAVQSWIQDYTKNLGVTAQANLGNPTDVIDLSNLNLTIAYAVPDDEKPVITKLTVGEVTGTSAEIFWESNEPTIGSISYGKTSKYDNETSKTAEYKITDNKILITGLAPGNTIHFQLHIFDLSANETISPDTTFLTVLNQAEVLGNELQIVDRSVLIPPKLVSAELVNLDNKWGIRVAWDTVVSQITQIILYRSVGDSSLTELKRFTPNEASYVDFEIANNKSYTYAVRIVKDNTASQRSQLVSIFTNILSDSKTTQNSFPILNNPYQPLIVVIAATLAVLLILYFATRKVTELFTKVTTTLYKKNKLRDPESYFNEDD